MTTALPITSAALFSPTSMARVLIKAGIWLYDGTHESRVEIFRDNAPLRSEPPEDGPYPPPPTDPDGFYHYAQVTIPGGGSWQQKLFDTAQGAIDHVTRLLPSSIKWTT